MKKMCNLGDLKCGLDVGTGVYSAGLLGFLLYKHLSLEFIQIILFQHLVNDRELAEKD